MIDRVNIYTWQSSFPTRENHFRPQPFLRAGFTSAATNQVASASAKPEDKTATFSALVRGAYSFAVVATSLFLSLSLWSVSSSFSLTLSFSSFLSISMVSRVDKTKEARRSPPARRDILGPLMANRQSLSLRVCSSSTRVEYRDLSTFFKEGLDEWPLRIESRSIRKCIDSTSPLPV